MNARSEKPCNTCRELKPLSQYYTTRKNKDGHRNICSDCLKLESVSRYRRTRSENPVAVWARYAVAGARSRARVAGIAFGLTREILIGVAPAICPVLGMTLDYSGAGNTRFSGTGHSPTVDRVVPSRGYVADNILVVSMRANLIKQNASPEEILRVGHFYADFLYRTT